MLTIMLKETELFDEKTNTFKKLNYSGPIVLEHSLVSISKWESKYHKPFLDETKKTEEELVDYIKCMTVSQNISDEVYKYMSKDQSIIKQINNYIQDGMTATTFTDRRTPQVKGRSKQKITSELVYYWMIANEIPFDCQKWHINRLLTLIRVCNIYNNPKGNKMSKREILQHNRALNAARRSKLGSNG